MTGMFLALLLTQLIPQEDTMKLKNLIGRSVLVESEGGHGTGVIIGTDLILTCRHVMGSKMFVNGLPAQVVRIDSEHDLMLLTLSTGKIPQIKFATAYKQDDDIVYIGNPLGHRQLIGRGKIVDVEGNYLYTDAHITFGASGSPVYNDKGHLVGLVTAIEGKTFGVIVPVDVIVHFLRGD